MKCLYRIYSIRAYIRKFLFEFNDASKRSFIFLCHFAFYLRLVRAGGNAGVLSPGNEAELVAKLCLLKYIHRRHRINEGYKARLFFTTHCYKYRARSISLFIHPNKSF